ncbi:MULTISPECIES: hypothetical protein [Brevibacillus]|uniref:Uncharacterized protein n=1 Tax=Brevibacillus invocatus TaxID=173959 RepID=A0A3M8C054_9BACL|nr:MULTISPECIES: hypothetical protein [Brevibacillus]MCM3429753.1 hypothetical protein [Brevibacillus invocatus]MDH4618107.1 hypothetical protein [Brevibacillus sp. AY1]RNB68285.1 hypothetical protein EDM52_20790 [Brevibacillus invocatus]
MGEFTTGILYPRKYEPKVRNALSKTDQPHFHRNVNGDWNAFFLQDEWLETSNTVSFLLKLSKQPIPLLWFHDAEDNGWGFRLFDAGYEVSSGTISYSLDVEMAELEFARLYPHVDLQEGISDSDDVRQKYEEILDRVVRSELYRREVGKGITRIKPQSFNRIVGPKQVQQLRSLFDLQLLTDVDEETGASLLYDSVDLFKEILGIEEMVWVNFAYLASGGRE